MNSVRLGVCLISVPSVALWLNHLLSASSAPSAVNPAFPSTRRGTFPQYLWKRPEARMPTESSRPLSPRLLRAVLGPGDVADRDLLARFAASRDEDAFTELVRRHGPMVLG